MVQSAFRLFNISRNGSGKGVTVAQSLKDHVRQRVSLSLVYAALVCAFYDISEAASNSVWKRPAWQDDAGRLVFFKNTGHTLLARFRSSAEGR